MTVLRGEQNVMLNFFDENLVAEDNSLRLNLSPVTIIMAQKGQRFTCSPRNMELIVTVLRGEQNVMLNFFDENLVAEDNSLRLNLSPVTNIMAQNGQRFTCSPRNMELLVYYTNTTFSIPPMTTPQKVIVMCEM